MRNALLIGGAIFASIIGVLFFVLMSTYSSLNTEEIGTRAVWRDSAVWYDNFWKKVKETAQVTDKYAADFKDVFIASAGKRYDGKDPAMSFIMESNPSLSPDLYKKLQDVIETGRNEFAQTQRTLVDRQRRYETNLTSPTGVLFAGLLGFPREQKGEYRPAKDLDGDGLYTVLDYPTVTSAETKEAFTTGEADALDVFGNKAAATAPAPTPEAAPAPAN